MSVSPSPIWQADRGMRNLLGRFHALLENKILQPYEFTEKGFMKVVTYNVYLHVNGDPFSFKDFLHVMRFLDQRGGTTTEHVKRSSGVREYWRRVSVFRGANSGDMFVVRLAWGDGEDASFYFSAYRVTEDTKEIAGRPVVEIGFL